MLSDWNGLMIAALAQASAAFDEPAWQAAAARLPEAVRSRWAETVAELRAPGREWDLRFANWSLGLVGRMRAARVPVAAGTDTPIRLAIPGESLHRELELLVESGFTPRQALGAATLEPARFLDLEREMGRIVEVETPAIDIVLIDRSRVRSCGSKGARASASHSSSANSQLVTPRCTSAGQRSGSISRGARGSSSVAAPSREWPTCRARRSSAGQLARPITPSAAASMPPVMV